MRMCRVERVRGKVPGTRILSSGSEFWGTAPFS